MRNKERIYTEAVGCYVTKETKEKLENMSTVSHSTISVILRNLIEEAIDTFNSDPLEVENRLNKAIAKLNLYKGK